MSLNNLKNYNWEQGTLSNPVSLTGTQFSWLINLLKKGTITKDIRGYIQVGSPITSYEKYLVELAKDEHNQPLLHLVNPTVTPVEYTIVPQASTIKEGTSTKLNINGIGLKALKFRIVNHTNTTPDYQARTTIDTELGYVRVAPAQENTTWTDVVTIQTCPVWEEWSDTNASIIEFDITVNAVAVTSVTITAPQYVKPGVTFNPIVNFLPVGHTKSLVNTLEDAAAKKGICFIPTSNDFTVGKTTDPTKMSAIAPNTETPVGETWSLGCGVYAFTNAQTMATPSVNVAVKYPYIQFTVTTDGEFSDISTANPKITLQKVDSKDTPIGEPIILTGTISGSSLIYTYGGGAVAGDGSETYKVTFGDAPEGYKNIQQMTITPNQVITEISVQYVVKRPDIYQVYADGTYEPISIVDNLGTFYPNKLPLAIAIVTENTSFMFAVRDNEKVKGKLIAGSVASADIQTIDCTVTSFELYAVTDYDFKRNTTGLHNYFADGTHTDGDCHVLNFPKVDNLVIGQQSLTGYIGAGGQIKILFDNYWLLNNYINNHFNIREYITSNAYFCSSTLESGNTCWAGRYYSGSSFMTRAVASSLDVLPIYEFNEDLYTKLPQRG